MSLFQPGLSAFLVDFRAVLAQLVGGLGKSELQALSKSALSTSVELLKRNGLAPLAKRLSALIATADADEHVVLEAHIREAIQSVSAESAPALVEAAAPASDTRSAPKHTARAKPPMRGEDMVLSAGAEPPDESAPQPTSPTLTARNGGSTRGGAKRATPKETTKEELPPETRYLVAGIAGHEPDQPLALKKYLFEIGVELEKSGDATTRLPDASVTHAEGEDSITLMIQVTSEDFVVSQKTAVPLELPRRGASDGKARFDVKPKNPGRGTLTISVHKEGNFLLQMEVSYSIGADAAQPVETKVHGRALTSAVQLRKRDLGMTIKPVSGGYECVVRGSTYTSVILKIDEARLADAIQVAREAMLGVVKQREDGVAVFQAGAELKTSDAAPKGTRVSKAAEDKALSTLAKAGGALFQVLFAGRRAGADEKAVGELLKKCALRSDERLTLQIVAEKFPVPWPVLYLGSIADDAALSWDNFLGMRCIIEQIPLQTDMLVDDSDIASDHPGLSVGVNVNASIDEQFELDVVKRQLDFWTAQAKSAGKRLGVTPRTSRADVLQAMSGKAPDQLMYLYCHAVTNGPQDPGGISGSCFVFTGDERLTLAELDANASQLPALSGNPLVFINACESGELRPEFYDGFIPYFMSKGARGVIGTECQTPAIFATEWALRFFPRFLQGEPLGELFLDLRREFLERHGNPLGLLYNVYCDGDTRVQPGLTI